MEFEQLVLLCGYIGGIALLGGLALFAAWCRPSRTFAGALLSFCSGMILFLAGLPTISIGITGMFLVNEFFNLFAAMTVAGVLATFFGPIRVWKSRIQFPKRIHS